MAKMGFFDLPIEIRLQIYSELLVHPETIVFRADSGPTLPPLLRPRNYGLCPAILQISKKAYSEGSPLLYSNNRFQFPDVFIPVPSLVGKHVLSAHIAPFISQIGSRACLIRHICMSFPSITHYQAPDDSLFNEAQLRNLDLIRDTCTSITTLELSVPVEYSIYALIQDDPIRGRADVIDMLDMRLKAITSLSDIIVNFQVYSEDSLDDDLTLDLLEKMRNCGWTVEFTILPPKVWVSDDDRVEFDNWEDCHAYNEEQFRLDLQRERQKEAEEAREEYYRRRDDPWWKNDSDYD